MKLTDKEYAMLKAMRYNDFHDNDNDPRGRVWIFSVTEDFGPSAGGIMSSLVSKGLATTTGSLPDGHGSDDGTCELTERGLEVFNAEEKERSDRLDAEAVIS